MTYLSIIIIIIAIAGFISSKINIERERTQLVNGEKESLFYNANPLSNINVNIWVSAIFGGVLIWVISISIFFSLA